MSVAAGRAWMQGQTRVLLAVSIHSSCTPPIRTCSPHRCRNWETGRSGRRRCGCSCVCRWSRVAGGMLLNPFNSRYSAPRRAAFQPHMAGRTKHIKPDTITQSHGRAPLPFPLPPFRPLLPPKKPAHSLERPGQQQRVKVGPAPWGVSVVVHRILNQVLPGEVGVVAQIPQPGGVGFGWGGGEGSSVVGEWPLGEHLDLYVQT